MKENVVISFKISIFALVNTTSQCHFRKCVML